MTSQALIEREPDGDHRPSDALERMAGAAMSAGQRKKLARAIASLIRKGCPPTPPPPPACFSHPRRSAPLGHSSAPPSQPPTSRLPPTRTRRSYFSTVGAVKVEGLVPLLAADGSTRECSLVDFAGQMEVLRPPPFARSHPVPPPEKTRLVRRAPPRPTHPRVAVF